jgi:signal transduction histidine kinase
VLWQIGFPPWRVGVLLLTLALMVALHLRQVLADRHCVPEGDGLTPFALILLATAVTGGLRSPLLLAVSGNFVGVLVRRGWTRGTQALLALVLGGAVAMAVAPEAWTGPRIPDPTYTVTVLVALVISVSLSTDYLVMVMKTAREAIHQLLRARDDTASQALARARELEQMSAQLSHELKNPLGAIKALVQLSRRSAQDADTRARLEVVEGEVARMQGILQGYLSFSRPLDCLHVEAVALGGLADEVLAVLEARAEDAAVLLHRSGDARLRADPRRLKEALLNLVANAIEATPPGGRVELRVEERDGAARVAVRDTGRGMAPEVLEKLGTPFFTTRDAGTGLGVVIARGVFSQHGGTLEYTSAPGLGTVATGTLPLNPCAEASDGARAARG